MPQNNREQAIPVINVVERVFNYGISEADKRLTKEFYHDIIKKGDTMKTYNLFISHSWAHSDQYDKLIDLLDKKSQFYYKDYSVPKDDPIHTNGTNKQLREKIEEKIRNCHVVLVLAGVYSTYSKWINIEIEIAKKENTWKKPIIAIEPWGSEKTSQHVKDNADEIVRWNSDSIVNAVKALGI